MLTQPLWWAGVGAGVGGFVFQAAALSFGPILLVQPVLITSLLFMLPLGVVINGNRPGWDQWFWAVSLTCVVALMMAVGNPQPGGHHVGPTKWLVTAAVGVPLVVVASVAAIRYPGRTRAMLLGALSGGLFGVVAVLMKVVSSRIEHRGIAALVTTVEPGALLVIAAIAMLLQQLSYQAGALRASFPAALIGEQVVGAALGIVALDETVGGGTTGHLILVAGAVFVCIATVRLAGAEDDEPAQSRIRAAGAELAD